MNGKLKLLIAYWLRSRFVTVWKFLLKASISADEFSLISPAGGSGLVGVGTLLDSFMLCVFYQPPPFIYSCRETARQ